jgi:Tol biopolymer transport system component
VVWSPRENKAIVTFPDGSKVLYDFDKKQQVTLPKDWADIEFSADGNQVAFKNLVENTDNRWLGVANPDGSNVQYIEPIGDKEADVQVAWSPTSQVAALYRESSTTASQEVYFIGLHGENFKSLQTDGRGFQGAWSPNGDKLLYNVYNSASNYNPTLWITNASGDNIGVNNTSLKVNTWASKCAFASGGGSVYCAVPNSLPDGTGLYPELAATTPDTFYKIDLTTGQQTVLAEPVNSRGSDTYTASNVILSPQGDYLYFTDIQTGLVYKIQLK